MNWLRNLFRRRELTPFQAMRARMEKWEKDEREKRLRATMRPDPDYRDRRLAQYSTERRDRYWRNVL